MLCINNTYTDAWFNLAAEEYLLKNFSEEFFMLYQNEPSVVIGKYQNVLAEVNLDFIQKNNIKIARRSSGGGTVFHDLGNLNLTFIENNKGIGFNRFAERIVLLLSTLGINAETDSRLAINIDGLKISGSAQCVHKDRVMYHATLLFSSDLHSLTSTLESDPKQLENKTDNRVYVKSVKSPVTNILEHLNTKLDVKRFKDYTMNYFQNEQQGNTFYQFTEENIAEINTLVEQKYGTPEWNYDGKKPKASNLTMQFVI